jgi:hypothetical protein|nr:MAG TPA: protein of unknown function (DUF4376) [Bacteriophage sp.]
MFYLISKKDQKISGYATSFENSEDFFCVSKEAIDEAAKSAGIKDVYGRTWKSGKLGDENGSASIFLDNSKYIKKLEQDSKIQNLKIQVGDKAFDADEKSQQRMMIAIQAMDDGESTIWRLADNTNKQVSKYELEQALKLAAAKMSKIILGNKNAD